MFIKDALPIYVLTVRQNQLYRGHFAPSGRTENIKLYFKTKEQAEYYRDTYYPGRDTDLSSAPGYQSDNQWVLLCNGAPCKGGSQEDPTWPNRNCLIFPAHTGIRVPLTAEDIRVGRLENVTLRLSTNASTQLQNAKNNSVMGVSAKNKGFSCAGPGPFFIDADIANSLSDATRFIYKANNDTFYIVDLADKHVTLVPESKCMPA